MSAAIGAAVRTSAARRNGATLRAVAAAGADAAPYSIEHDVTDPDSLLAWHDFRRSWALANKSERTRDGYAFILAQLARFSGGTLLDTDRALAAAFVGALADRPGVSDTSVASYHRQLRAWFGWAARPADAMVKNMPGGGYVDANPFAGVPVRQATETAKTVLDDGQLRRLLATTARRQATPGAEFGRLRDAAILRILCEAGSPRVSELAALDVTDIDLASDVLVIRKGKGNKSRQIPLSASTAQALTRYLRARADVAAARWGTAAHGTASIAVRSGRASGRLFLGKHGPTTVTGIQQMLNRRCDQAGIPRVSPHELRHTAYSRWEDAGGLPNDAMALFGWSSDTMTRIYGRSAAARRAMDKARRISLADL